MSTHSRTRTRGWRVALAALMVGMLLALAGGGSVQAQEAFSVVKATFEGGGGQSAAGQFSLTGTIAQPDAGQLVGGQFALTGGYWSSLATEPTGQIDRTLLMPFLGRPPATSD